MTQRVFEIFAEATALEPGARRAYVESSCEGDEETRDEVLRLLRVHEEAEDNAPTRFDEQVYALVGSRAQEALEDASAACLDQIEGFRVVRRLGEGGMGTVYLAEQAEPERLVAIKILRADVASQRAQQRFHQEARFLARLQHPSIAQIYASGRFAGPTGWLPYLVMEYVDGQTLTQFAESLGERERLELFAEICDAVQHAHQNGVIHRDLKPENLLVEVSGRPKVVDFGVSRTGDADAGFTKTGQVIGTLDYMSAEQASGLRDVDTRTDVYSLGVVGYELVCGQLPREVSALPLEQALRVLREDTAPLLESVDRHFRGDLSLIFAKALDPERARRYPSAAALAADVRRFLSDEPIMARPPTLSYQLHRFVRRHRAPVAAAGITVLALIIGLVVALLARADEAEQRQIAESQTTIAERETARANRVAYAAQIQAASLALRSHDAQSVHRKLLATDPVARGWEFRYLQNRLDQDLGFYPMELRAKPTPSFSPDTERVAVAVGDRGVRVFDFAEKRWEDAIDFPFALHAIAMLADGRIVAVPRTSESDSVAARHLWVAEEGDVSRTPAAAPEGGRIIELAVSSSDGQVAVLTQHDGRSELLWFDPRSWESRPGVSLPKGAQTLRLDGASATFLYRTSASLPDGMKERTVEVRRVADGLLAARSQLDTSGAAFAKDGARYAHWNEWGIGVESVDPGDPDWTRRLGGDKAACAVFVENGTTLVTGHGDAALRFWDTASGAGTGVSSGRADVRNPLLELARSHDGEEIRAVGLDGVRIRPATPHPASRVLPHETSARGVSFPYVYSVAFDANERRLASAGWDGTVRIWDVATGRQLTALEHSDPKILWARFSRDGTRLLSCTYVNTPYRAGLSLWNVVTGQREQFVKRDVWCEGGAQGPGDAWVIGVKSELQVLDPVTLSISRTATVSEHQIERIAISPDQSLIACSTKKDCVVLDAETLEPLYRFDLATHSVAFSADGGRLATGGRDGTLRVFDLADGSEVMRTQVVRSRLTVGGSTETASAGSPNVYAVAFTPDGRRIACGCRMGDVFIFDAESGDEIVRLDGHDAYVHDLEFRGDGAVLASASGDNTARLWDARPVAVRLDEERRALEAEAAIRPYVDDLFDRLGTKEAVAAAITADSTLDRLARHAALNLVMQR